MLIGALAAATVGGAWAFQLAGYTPCELCLKERIPYYVAIGVAILTALAARRGYRGAVLAGFGVLILCFMAGTALGLYHTGVEMKVWPGPSECSGSMTAPPDVGDFLKTARPRGRHALRRGGAADLRALAGALERPDLPRPHRPRQRRPAARGADHAGAARRWPRYRTVTEGTTDMPGPSSTSGLSSNTILTGIRCTTLT